MPNHAVSSSKREFLYQIFYKVEEILVSANERLFFVAESFKLSTTPEHFHCYVVRETEEKAVVSDLASDMYNHCI